MRTPPKIRYVAEPQHVREVTLIGAVNFAFWSDYLKAEGLKPMRCDDTAEAVIVAAEMVYLGIRFTEVSFSVRTLLARDGRGAGMRLLHAFTSSRVFAWCERTMFATPYAHGMCQVSVRSPHSVRVRDMGGRVLAAEMSPPARATTRAGHERWEVPVFLPPRGDADGGRLFFGRLSGHTEVYPFLSGDRFELDATAANGVLQPLAESGFRPQEWVVRADATHGKSKTYRRTDFFPDGDEAA